MPVFDAQQVIVGIVRVTDRLGDVYQGFQRIRNLVIFSLLGAFVVALVIAWRLAQRTERRLQDVTRAVEQVAEGHAPALTPDSTPREFRGVLQAVQALSDRLKSSEETRKQLLANLVHELGVRSRHCRPRFTRCNRARRKMKLCALICCRAWTIRWNA